jgi:LysM repeat protein
VKQEGDLIMVRFARQLAVIAVVIVVALGVVAQPAHAQNQTHTVRRGETLSSIAARYGTTVQAIVQANGLANANTIYAGQRLIIPGAGSSGPTQSGASQSGSSRAYTVQRGDTLFAIATRHGTTVAAIMQANGLGSYLIYMGQRLVIPGAGSSGATSGAQARSGASQAASGGTYTVRRGDTLSAIAARHGTTVAALMQANGLRSSLIYAGQRLIIPVGSSGSASSAPTQSGSTQSGTGRAHTVQRGDTLFGIAVRYGTTVPAIMQANNLYSSVIYVGQRLIIPGAGSSGAASSGTAVGGAKRIVVDLSEQRMYVYQNGQLLWNWVVSTGRPGQETAVGHYKVLNKIPNAYAYTCTTGQRLAHLSILFGNQPPSVVYWLPIRVPH